MKDEVITMSYPYTSEEIGLIEEEFKKLDLEKGDIEIIDGVINVDIIES